MAAHAVLLHDLRIPLLSVAVDLQRAAGQLEAAWRSLAFAPGDRSPEAREALERDCVAIHAGVVGKAFALGWEHTTHGWSDACLTFDLLERLEYDECLRSSWHEYQRERARALVEAPSTWTRIELLATRFAAQPMMRGDDVAIFLGRAQGGGVVVPSRIPWRATPRPASSETSNAVLVWQQPGLIEILTRAGALDRSAGDER